MSYFKTFSDILYPSPLKTKSSSSDFVRAKNIFRRAKVRDDLFQTTAAFEKYSIEGNERPDQVAKKLYGSSDLDWIILIANNIQNLREEWPLSNYEFNKYLENKYSRDELGDIHHYETEAVYDTRGKLIVPPGKYVDADYSVTYFDYFLTQEIELETNYSFDSTDTTFDSSLVRWNDQQEIEIKNGVPVVANPVKAVTILEYEIQRNEKKRNIFVVQKRFLQTMIDDFEDIMRVRFSSQYVDRITKKGEIV